MMREKRDIRRLPAPTDGEGRVETGAVQFGDDWTGLFVRGDDCAALFFAWGMVRALLPPKMSNSAKLTIGPLERVMRIIREDVDHGEALARYEDGLNERLDFARSNAGRAQDGDVTRAVARAENARRSH